ncbi:MAG TPA: GerMN domain-containing protein [Vicinamibacterales bacterium]|nr:GerMN domain-containing protein [Vicinamibacterales bacterium]
MNRRQAAIAAIVIFGIVAAWILFIGLPRWYSARRERVVAEAAAPAGGAQPAVRKITATLFYVSDDGMALVPVQREVAFGATTPEQARAIVEAQLTAAVPQVSAIPAGVTLRGVFITERGDAFVDLSGDITAKHPGGSLDEIFTVYTLVNALTVNLPAIQRVQILVDGKEVDTLAGHVDLRHPLAKSLEWVIHDTH